MRVYIMYIIFKVYDKKDLKMDLLTRVASEHSAWQQGFLMILILLANVGRMMGRVGRVSLSQAGEESRMVSEMIADRSNAPLFADAGDGIATGSSATTTPATGSGATGYRLERRRVVLAVAALAVTVVVAT